MKTLLLILGVVAFVYLDSGYSRKCYTCDKPFPLVVTCMPVECAEGLDQCYINKTQSMMDKVLRGCTTGCTSNTTTYCCSMDKCNTLYVPLIG